MKPALSRIVAVVGGATTLLLGVNYGIYAATGSALILGGSNYAGAVTSVSRTTSGAVLNLHAYSSANPPFTTNAKGLVTNLNSQYLSGQTLAQVQAGAAAAALARLNFTFNRTSASETYIAPMSSLFSYSFSGVQSASVPGGFPYRLAGTMTFACDTALFAQSTETYTALVAVLHSDGTWTTLAQLTTNAGDCGAATASSPVTFTITVPAQTVKFRVGDTIVAAANGQTIPGQQYNTPLWPALTFTFGGTFLGGANNL